MKAYENQIHEYYPEFCGTPSVGSLPLVALQCSKLSEYLGGVPWSYKEGFVDYSFGCKAGPSHSVENMAHEVAHVLQLPTRKIRRVDATGFGFKVPKVEVLGNTYVEPTTDFISQMEMETMAIQALLLHYVFGSDVDMMVDNLARSIAYLPDWALVEQSEVPTTIRNYVEAWKSVDLQGMWHQKNLVLQERIRHIEVKPTWVMEVKDMDDRLVERFEQLTRNESMTLLHELETPFTRKSSLSLNVYNQDKTLHTVGYREGPL